MPWSPLLNIRGPAGPAGATGAKGDPGAQGATGAVGGTGAKGDRGDAGPQGTQGPAGTTGAKGDKGDTGAAGRDFNNRRVQSVTASGTVTCNWGAFDEIRLTLTGNTTLSFQPGNDGQGCTLKIKQNSTGNFTLTLPGSVRFNADVVAYTNTKAADKADRVGFIYDAGDSRYDFVSVIKGF